MLPYLLGSVGSFAVSSVVTAIVFFAIGSIKSLWSTVSWWRSGLSTLAVGAMAAALAYLAGVLLRGLAS